jgi:hypothetical protein
MCRSRWGAFSTQQIDNLAAQDIGDLGGELASNFSDGSPAWVRLQEPRMCGLEFRYNFN